MWMGCTVVLVPDPEWGNVRPDWVGVSPLGNYLVVQWVRDGVTRCSGFESFDLTTGAFIGRAYEGHAHSDMGVAADAQTEYLVVFELEAAPPNQGNSSVGLRLLPGTQTISPPIYLQPTHWNNGHISCQGPMVCALSPCGRMESNGWSSREGSWCCNTLMALCCGWRTTGLQPMWLLEPTPCQPLPQRPLHCLRLRVV